MKKIGSTQCIEQLVSGRILDYKYLFDLGDWNLFAILHRRFSKLLLISIMKQRQIKFPNSRYN